jgi:NADPH-dependent glutamate synthase beta subunit-like oxidoreductase
MRVQTSSPDIESRRRAKLRELFATHPHACVQCAQRAGCPLEPCSTNVAKNERCCPIFHTCELRRVAEHVGIPEDTPRYRPAGLPVVDDEPLLLWDANLCIGCLRCVRICRDVRQVDALGFVLDERGQPVVGTRRSTLGASGCRFCLSCVEVCPTGALRLKVEDPRQDGERLTHCVAACPAEMDVPRYLREIRRGDFGRAEAVIREAAPLPRVLGEACYHPCEEHCLRTHLGEPLAICALKRAAVEHADTPVWKSHLHPDPATGRTIAIIGAGPAGLTAAWFLRLKGHAVTLFDAQSSPGGWLRDGIPRYRLSAAAVQADIEDILGMGVDFKAGVEVGKDVALEGVRRQYDAVLVAAGARRAKQLACTGGDLPGVESGLELLQGVATSEREDRASFAGQRIVIIGGGNVAIDVARTALRLGSRDVHVYCLEQRGAMPAHDWEVGAAESEGAVLHPGWGPMQIVGRGKVERVDFCECVSVFDEEGRFAPTLDSGRCASQEADRVLLAIGQEPDLGFLDGVESIRPTAVGYIGVGAESMQTSIEGVFAAGEVVSGPASVVEAIGQARRAASGIDRYLGGSGDLHFRLLEEVEPDAALGRVEGFADLARLRPLQLAGTEAVAEASRCLGCDLRLALTPVPAPPAPWRELTIESVATVPESEGVYRLLDENKVVYAIKGVDNLRHALSQVVTTSTKARFFLYDEDPMFSKRESEIIQQYLQEHGCMPAGEGDEDLDDLF